MLFRSIFNETRGFGFGRSSTNGTYSYTNPGTYVEAIYRLTGTGTSRYSLIVPRSSVLTYGNSSIYSGASYFVMDGILADYNTGGFNANSNQSTIGMIGPGSSNADPGSGNYYGHGSTEGNYEGWYDNSGNSADCQGYTTWVR